jgi:hypothetical protein
MSQPAQPGIHLGTQLRAHWIVVLAALLALLATTVVILVLAINDAPSPTATSDVSQAAVRSDGGPDESGIAATVGSQPTAVAPDESNVAAAISAERAEAPAATPVRPDESGVAASISGG